MPIKMTRAEYETKYGQKPEVIKTEEPKEEKDGFLSNIFRGAGKLKESIVQRTGEAVTEIKKTKLPTEPVQLFGERKEKGIGSAILEVPGAFGRVFTDFTRGAIDGVIEKGVEKLKPETKEKIKEAGTDILNTRGGQLGIQAFQKGAEAWKGFEEKNPDLARDLKNVAVFGEAVADLVGVGAGVKVTKGFVRKGVGEFGEQVGKKGQDIISALRKGDEVVEEGVKKIPTKLDIEKEDIVGRIIQAKKKDRPIGVKALEEIDTKGIKTFEDLKGRFAQRIGEVAGELDEFLGKQKISFRTKDLGTTKKVGTRVVKENFVTKAITQLKELYTKIDDLEANATVLNLSSKLRRKGLTPLELNNLSREYGSAFGNKAFSKVTRDPLTSVNAQAFENTRKGLKDVVRSKIKGDKPIELDAKLSALINTKKVVTKLEEQANKAIQKLKNEGLMKKLSNRLGSVIGAGINVSTFGTLPSILARFLPKGISTKSMSILEIQDILVKNIKQFNKIVSKRQSQGSKLNQLENFFVKLEKVGAETEGFKKKIKLTDKSGKIKTDVLVKTAGATGGAVLLNQALKQRIKFKRKQDEEKKPTNTPSIIKGIAHAETRGETQPYSFSQWSNPKLKEKSSLGKALGKYQITEARLKEKSKDFLGVEITPKEFLENKFFQDKFMKEQIDWLKDNGLNDEEIIAVHRHGWGNLKPEQIDKAVNQRKNYIEETKKGMK